MVDQSRDQSSERCRILYIFRSRPAQYEKERQSKRFLSFMADESCELGCVRTEENLGNPVWFSKKYKRELLSLTKDQGGKKILKKHIENARIFQGIGRN